SRSGEQLEPSTGRQMDLVRGTILNVEWLIFVLAMIPAPRHFLDVLKQGSAEGDVKLLETAAHGEQRHAALDAAPDQRQGRRVAPSVLQYARGWIDAAIVPRRDV